MTATLQQKSTGREEQLQFLRFLAFLNVFICHAEVWLFFSYPASHCGAAAVSFFFVLSGGLTGYAAFGRQQTLTLKAWGKGIRKKLKKLYPLYFMTMLIPFLFSNVPQQLAAGDFTGSMPLVKQLIKNLLLIQSWFPEGYFSFNGVGWFLASLMFLYLWNLPATILLNRLWRHPRGRWLLLPAFGGILFVTAAYCYLTQSYDMDYLQYILPAARLGEFFSGMILGFAIRAIKPRLPSGTRMKWLYTLAEAAALLFWFLSLRRPGNYWMNRIVSWLIPNLLIFAVFLLGGGWISDLFRWRPLVRLGDVSFECFLLHNLIIINFLQINPLHLISEAGKPMAFCICLGLTILLSLLLNRRGEKGA